MRVRLIDYCDAVSKHNELKNIHQLGLVGILKVSFGILID